MNRFSLILLLACLACQNGGEVVSPKVKPLVEAVYASGVVAARDEYEIFAQVDGYLLEKVVADGDTVKEGDILFIIDSDQQSSRFKIAQDNYALARKNAATNSPVVAELTAAVASVKSKLQFDSINYVRYTNLLKQNATTRLEFERIKLLYENSRNDYALQVSRLEKVKNQLATELSNAQGQLQIAADESGRYVVRSKVNGKLFSTTKDEGELIRRGELLGVAGRSNDFYLKLNVDELDIQRIKKNHQVKVKIDAYPEKIFTATVSKIYPLVNQQQQSIRVDASFDEVLPGSYTGLAVEANIIVREKKDALVIPKSALLTGDSIFIKAGDEEKKIKIQKGIETLDEVEVVSGLQSNQEVVLK